MLKSKRLKKKYHIGKYMKVGLSIYANTNELYKSSSEDEKDNFSDTFHYGFWEYFQKNNGIFLACATTTDDGAESLFESKNKITEKDVQFVIEYYKRFNFIDDKIVIRFFDIYNGRPIGRKDGVYYLSDKEVVRYFGEEFRKFL